MDEKEIMTTETIENEVSANNETSGIGTGTAMLLGGLVTIGIIFGGKRLRNFIAKHVKRPDVIIADATDVEEDEKSVEEE